MRFVESSFQGRCRRSVRLTSIEMRDVGYHAHAAFPPHAHPHASLGLAVMGSYEDRVSDHWHGHDALTLNYKPARVEHESRCGSRGTRSLGVIFVEDPGRYQAALSAGARPECRWFLSSDLAKMMLKMWCAAQRGDSGGASRCERDFLELLRSPRSLLARATHTRNDLVDEAQAIIRNRFRSSLSTSDVARTLGVHPVYLARLYRRTLRRSVIDEIRRRRVGYVMTRLLSTDQQISVIAADAGFADHSEMARRFRQALGVTPTVFRSSLARS